MKNLKITNLTDEEATKRHSLCWRVIDAVSKEIPVIGTKNMFSDGDYTFELLGEQAVCGKVKITDYVIFGLRYPYDNTQKKNIDAFVLMAKKTDAYQRYLNEYVVSDEYFNELQEYAQMQSEKFTLKNDSHKHKKYIGMQWYRGDDINDTVSSVGLTGDDMAYDKKYIDDIVKEYGLSDREEA